MSLDQTLAALADPTRRAMLEDLKGGERRITELASPFDVSFNAISKHVKVLESAGLIRRRKEGRAHFISANPDPMEEAANWFAEQAVFWNARLNDLEKALLEDDEEKRK